MRQTKMTNKNLKNHKLDPFQKFTKETELCLNKTKFLVMPSLSLVTSKFED